jgi:signal transduction histidine kinase
MESRQNLILTHSLLLGERLYLFARLRFLAAAGILVGGVFATYVVGIQGLDLCGLCGAAAVLAAYNTAVFFAVRPFRHLGEGTDRHRRLVLIAYLSVSLDYLVLTYAIWQVGGARSPFLAFYLLHVILASVLLSRAEAYGHAAVGYLLLSALVLGEWSGLVPHRDIAGATAPGDGLDGRFVLTLLFVYGLLTAVTTMLTTGIVRLLRSNEHELRGARDRLERLADMRRSFLHVVLHDVRSPVGTVVAMLEGLTGGIDGPLGDAQKERVGRAGQRLHGVLDLLRSLRVLADLETERLETLMAPVDLLATIRAAVEEQQDLAEQHGVSLQASLPASLPTVEGVERLMSEALANYLTNAIKYTPRGGTVVVGASSTTGIVRIEVRDSGPGISADDQGRLFQEFAKVGRAGGGGKKPGGIGLGLSIVRRIAEAHGGRAGVVSEIGSGSTFFLEFEIRRSANTSSPAQPGTDLR